MRDKILVNEELIRSGANINEIACVRSEYLNPKSVSNDYLWKNVPEGNADFLRGTSLSFWNVEGSDYVVVNNSIYKPNEFDTPGFTVSTNEKDFSDRRYRFVIE